MNITDKEFSKAKSSYSESKKYFFGSVLLLVISYPLFWLFTNTFYLFLLTFLPMIGLFSGFAFAVLGAISGLESYQKKEDNARYRKGYLIGNILILIFFIFLTGANIIALIKSFQFNINNQNVSTLKEQILDSQDQNDVKKYYYKSRNCLFISIILTLVSTIQFQTLFYFRITNYTGVSMISVLLMFPAIIISMIGIGYAIHSFSKNEIIPKYRPAVLIGNFLFFITYFSPITNNIFDIVLRFLSS